MSAVIAAIKQTGLNKHERKKLYLDLIPAFEDFDCDTLDECRSDDIAFKEAFKQLNNGDNDE